MSIIPPLIGRRTDKPPRGRWRRWMTHMMGTQRARRRCGYTQRWQVETVNSMIKRNLGSFCRGKSCQSRQRDLRLKALVHNLMILRPASRVESEQSCPVCFLRPRPISAPGGSCNTPGANYRVFIFPRHSCFCSPLGETRGEYVVFAFEAKRHRREKEHLQRASMRIHALRHRSHLKPTSSDVSHSKNSKRRTQSQQTIKTQVTTIQQY
jgi:hypothetical protein